MVIANYVQKHFEDDFEHNNGWAMVIPEAYYYLPEYEPNCSEWEPYSLSEMGSKQLSVIAYSNSNSLGYLLIDKDCVIGHCGKNSLEDILESNFLSMNTFPIY